MKRKYRVGVLVMLAFLAALTFAVIIIGQEVDIMRKGPVAKKLTIEKIKAKHEPQLLGIEGVAGVGIGEDLGKPVIKVYVVRKTKSLQEKIPAQIEGYPVSVEVSGEFHAF